MKKDQQTKPQFLQDNLIHCLNNQTINNPTELLSNLNDNPVYQKSERKQVVNTIRNGKFPTIPMFIHDDNDT